MGWQLKKLLSLLVMKLENIILYIDNEPAAMNKILGRVLIVELLLISGLIFASAVLVFQLISLGGVLN